MGKKNAPVFVHFIPPPLRKEGLKHLPWIVHTTDGSGCHEAKHVSFNTLSGFQTYEGQPPEQAEGKACSCQISNHHLRGSGRVRWEDTLAIIEANVDDEDEAEAQMINGAAYREEARRKGELLASAKEEIKKLREGKATAAGVHEEVRKKLLDTERDKTKLEEGPVRQLGVMKIKFASL